VNKKQLRAYYKAKRNALVKQDRIEAAKRIADQLQKNWDFKDELISMYLPIARLNEIDTASIAKRLGTKNRICAPVANFEDHSLTHVELDLATELEENEWGIPEPINGKTFSVNEITVVLVPLLISDHKGHRLGYGKGFYDRFLKQCSAKTLFIGLNYFDPIEKIPELNAFDIPLHFLVTPDKVIGY
jgi:5-formyltetrahydrofolate cyclo-ligase